MLAADRAADFGGKEPGTSMKCGATHKLAKKPHLAVLLPLSKRNT